MQNIITIYEELNSNVKFTVALPIYNSKKIAWISLESLIRQENINFDWELIVYEEIHSESVCPEILEEYKERLVDINCKKIIYITKEGRPSLLDKWIKIASHASKTSEAYLLHAADCYSPKNRLKKSYEVIVEKDYDWYDQKKGYFYSFISDNIILYNFNGLTNLNMCTKTKYIKTLPNSSLKKGIDGYIYNHLKKNANGIIKHFKDTNLYLDSVDTHGFNNISKSRENFFYTKPDIFTITNLELKDLSLPNEINEKLLKLTEYKQLQLNETEVSVLTNENILQPKVENKNILQPKIKIKKKYNKVVNQIPQNSTQHNMTKNIVNKLASQNNNKGVSPAGKISI